MNYLHESNKDKPYVDWRLPENRMEGFLRWLKWRMDWCDLDHYVCNNAYRDYAKMTKEQKYWYCLIFGMTYQSEMAWVIYSQFPNLYDINLDELQKWNVGNMERQRYTTDTRYNKGRITEQVASIHEAIDKKNGSIINYFEDLVEENEHKSFENIYNNNLNLRKYGRMTSWITCQLLFETADLPIRPNTTLAWEPATQSPRSGLFFLYGKDANAKDKVDAENVKWIREKEIELYNLSVEYIGEEHQDIFSNYLLESHLCQYKKLLIGGDYPGHSAGDHITRAGFLAGLWPEVDFTPFYEHAIQRHHPSIRGKMENKAFRHLCEKTGQFINMHQEYEDLPNMYLELDIDIESINTKEAQPMIMSKIESYNTVSDSRSLADLFS